MQVGLFFGSFNPVHIGHLIIANHLQQNSDLDEVWFVVTPHSPFKKKQSLLDNYQRLEMVHRATQDYPNLRPCDIEFKLPQPNYTIDSLVYLEEKYPHKTFHLIMGSDNLQYFHKWKNHHIILENHRIYVYPRLFQKKRDIPLETHPKVQHIDAPIIELSATHIRQAIAAGKNVRPLLPESVWEYVIDMNFYKG